MRNELSLSHSSVIDDEDDELDDLPLFQFLESLLTCLRSLVATSGGREQGQHPAEPAVAESARGVVAAHRNVSAAKAREFSLERERHLAVIQARIINGHDPGVFAKKAQTLLTMSWSKADWPARKSILRTVHWLLRLERHSKTSHE
jgi:hypothetical protein